MRTLKSPKTIIYMVGIASLLAVFVNIYEMGKGYGRTNIFKIYERLYPSHNVTEIRPVLGANSAGNERMRTEVNRTREQNNNGSHSKEFIVFRNVPNGSKIPPNPIIRNVLNPFIKGGPYTAAEFRLKAQQDKQFLSRILSQPYLHPKSKDMLRRYFTGSKYLLEYEFDKTFKDNLQKDFDVSNDVMVFLHIQKTGGMRLNDRFFSELQIPFRCKCTKKPCTCLNPKGNAWIYTSLFSGWPCGLHADWTQLHRCIPGQIDTFEGKNRKRRYFYFSQFRDPINRYLSEFYHQSVRGHHWQDALLGCGPGFSDWADIKPMLSHRILERGDAG